MALKWEELQVPFTISVDNPTDLHLAAIRNELRNFQGFNWQNWVGAANYALQVKRNDDALEFADAAVNRQFIGVENFQTLSTLARAQDGRQDAGSGRARDQAVPRRRPDACTIAARSWPRERREARKCSN